MALKTFPKGGPKGGAISVVIDGVIPLLKQLKAMDVGVQREVQALMERELASWTLSARMLAPVKTHALELSGRLTAPTGTGIVKYQIIFGGVTRKGKFVHYAAWRHEDSTRPQFLRKVVDARAPQLEKKIARAMFKVMKSV